MTIWIILTGLLTATVGFAAGAMWATRTLPRALARLSDAERAVFARKVAAARDR